MNPEQALLKAADLLDAARPADSGTYTLIIIERKMALEKTAKGYGRDGILAHLTARHINEGLPTKLWNRIRDRYASFSKKGLI